MSEVHMIDDVLDLYGEDKNNEMNDELLEMYLRENEAVDEEPEEERASSDDNRPEHSLKSHGTEKANSSKFTISTKDSQRTGKKGKFYEILRDEGKSYKYEDDPRKYMQIRKKIQNRESARRVRLREKDGATCLQSRFIEMQENNQRLQIENTALRSENIMLRNQVEFMEKLLLQRTNLPSGSVDEEHKLSRVEARGTVSKNIGVIALVCMVLVATYLPEQSSGSSQDGTIQQRMLSEISTGFNLFNSKNLASLFLSLFRVAAFMTILGYISYTGILAYKKASKRSEEDILQGLISKKNS